MQQIDFPSWSWVCKLGPERKYTGSIGTDSQKGCLSKYTFHYAIWKDETEEGEKRLHISCIVQPPVYSQETNENEEITYPFSEEYAEEAKQWIYEQVEKRRDIIG